MNTLMKNILKSIESLFIVSLDLFKNSYDMLNEGDEKSLENLLNKPEDNFEFQKTLSQVLKDSSSREVVLNGKNVNISI